MSTAVQSTKMHMWCIDIKKGWEFYDLNLILNSVIILFAQLSGISLLRIHVCLSVFLEESCHLENCILTNECHLTHLRWKLNLLSYLFKITPPPPKHALSSHVNQFCWNSMKRCQKNLLKLFLESQINITCKEELKIVEYKISRKN